MRKHSAGACALAAVFLATAAPAEERMQAGSLTCDVSAGLGLILGSQRQVYCTFTPAVPGPYAPTNRSAGGLAGAYGGASAEASIIAGLGANVLVGGSGSTVALQPVSVQGQKGLNLAAGIAGLDLQFVR